MNRINQIKINRLKIREQRKTWFCRSLRILRIHWFSVLRVLKWSWSEKWLSIKYNIILLTIHSLGSICEFASMPSWRYAFVEEEEASSSHRIISKRLGRWQTPACAPTWWIVAGSSSISIDTVPRGPNAADATKRMNPISKTGRCLNQAWNRCRTRSSFASGNPWQNCAGSETLSFIRGHPNASGSSLWGEKQCRMWFKTETLRCPCVRRNPSSLAPWNNWRSTKAPRNTICSRKTDSYTIHIAAIHRSVSSRQSDQFWGNTPRPRWNWTRIRIGEEGFRCQHRISTLIIAEKRSARDG